MILMREDTSMELAGKGVAVYTSNVLRETSINHIGDIKPSTNEMVQNTSPILCIKPLDIRMANQPKVVDAHSNVDRMYSSDDMSSETSFSETSSRSVVTREVVKIDDENIRRKNGFVMKKGKRKKGSIDEILSQLGAKKRKEELISRERTIPCPSNDTENANKIDNFFGEKLDKPVFREKHDSESIDPVSTHYSKSEKVLSICSASILHHENEGKPKHFVTKNGLLALPNVPANIRRSEKNIIERRETTVRSDPLLHHPVTKILTYTQREHTEPAFQPRVNYTEQKRVITDTQRGVTSRGDLVRKDAFVGYSPHTQMGNPGVDCHRMHSAFYNISPARVNSSDLHGSLENPALQHSMPSSIPNKMKNENKLTRKRKDGNEKERYSNLTSSQLQRRLVANARERSRVHALSTAFEALRTAVPSYSPEQKLSKLTILRVAINYINALEQVLTAEPSRLSENEKFVNNVNECSCVLQTEYGRSKMKLSIG